MIAKLIPHCFTAGNLALGMIALILAVHGEVVTASLFVLFAMLVDGLDGRIARALKVQSEFGKQLDSLSDIVSFGAAPAIVAYVAALGQYAAAGWIVVALFPVCGALRLARFNVRKSGGGHFTGLPIPVAGGILCMLSLFVPDVPTIIVLLSCVALSFLMVSNFRYPSFKHFKLPKVYVWVLSALLLIGALLIIYFPSKTKLLLAPLALYALWGLKKTINSFIVERLRKRWHRRRREEQTAAESDMT